MSRLGLRMNTNVLAKCAGCWSNTGLVATRRTLPASMRQTIRHASTTRSKTKSDTTAAEVVAVPKKKISTKSTTATTATKRPRKKAEAVASSPTEEAPEPVKKTTRAASTKSTAASAKKKAESTASTVKATATKAKASATTRASTAAKKSASTTSATTRKATAASSSTKAEPAKHTTDKAQPPVDAEGRTFENAVDPEKWSMRFAEKAATMKPVDRNSPEYKKAGRNWLGLMVGLPFLIVSSYLLFQRLALGKMPPPRPLPEDAAPEKASEKETVS